MNNIQENFRKDLRQVMEGIENMLIQKNAAYGDSVLNPVRIFSKSDTIEQIDVRLDDKLSRLARGKEAGEDVYMDLIGYLVIREIAKLRQARVDNGIMN